MGFAAPPDVYVVPSGRSYVYMVPDYDGVYFYGGNWYRFYNDRWFRSSHYTERWDYIETSIVPKVIIVLPPEYIDYVPSDITGYTTMISTATGSHGIKVGIGTVMIGISMREGMIQGGNGIVVLRAIASSGVFSLLSTSRSKATSSMMSSLRSISRLKGISSKMSRNSKNKMVRNNKSKINRNSSSMMVRNNSSSKGKKNMVGINEVPGAMCCKLNEMGRQNNN